MEWNGIFATVMPFAVAAPMAGVTFAFLEMFKQLFLDVKVMGLHETTTSSNKISSFLVAEFVMDTSQVSIILSLNIKKPLNYF